MIALLLLLAVTHPVRHYLMLLYVNSSIPSHLLECCDWDDMQIYWSSCSNWFAPCTEWNHHVTLLLDLYVVDLQVDMSPGWQGMLVC